MGDPKTLLARVIQRALPQSRSGLPEPGLDAPACGDIEMKAEGLSTPASREMSLHPTT